MKSACLTINELTEEIRESMFALLNRFFWNVTHEAFASDLQSKDRVVMINEAEALVGFSTFTLRPALDLDNQPASILCSGDTIVDPQYWGSSALGRTLIQSAWELHRQTKNDSFWWLLITSGPRTWGVLPTFFLDFHPHPNHAVNGKLETCTRSLCHERWPGCLDEESGLIRLPHPQRLRPPLDIMPESRKLDSGFQWYERTNPGWKSGDELPSLVRIEPSNLTRAGWRYLSGYLEAYR